MGFISIFLWGFHYALNCHSSDLGHHLQPALLPRVFNWSPHSALGHCPSFNLTLKFMPVTTWLKLWTPPLVLHCTPTHHTGPLSVAPAHWAPAGSGPLSRLRAWATTVLTAHLHPQHLATRTTYSLAGPCSKLSFTSQTRSQSSPFNAVLLPTIKTSPCSQLFNVSLPCSVMSASLVKYFCWFPVYITVPNTQLR